MSFKTILVKDQNADNTLKLHVADSPCCGDSANLCQYTASYAAANTVTAVTFVHEGANKTVTFSAVSGAAAVRAAIVAALAANGYEDFNDGLESLEFVTNGSNFDITAYSDVKLVSLTASGGTATFTEKCTETGLCTYTKTGIGSNTTDTLTVNGVTSDLVDVVAGTTTASAINASIVTALTAGAARNASAATVEVGTGGSATYTVTIQAAPGTRIAYNGTTLTPTNCRVAWA